MKSNFDPVRTWLRYGVSDLFLGFTNQEEDIFRYRTFFFIMAAEKHLKAVLIEASKDKYEKSSTFAAKRKAVDSIAKSYSHNFKKMIEEVGELYQSENGVPFLKPKIFDYDVNVVIESMKDGYMETRYPVVSPTANRYLLCDTNGIYHNVLEATFFTDFIQGICHKCWNYLFAHGADCKGVLEHIEEMHGQNRYYSKFKINHLDKLQI